MKRRICVRSMVLGAAIMLIGMWISPLISPPVTAERNGVFDKIQCREIEVVDKDGETAIRLYTTKHGGDIRMDSKDGRIATMSINESGGWLYLSGKGRGSGGNVGIYTSEASASLDVEDTLLSDGGIRMYASDSGGSIKVEGKGLHDGGSAEMLTDEHGGVVGIGNNQGKTRAVMGVNAYGNGAVSTWDRNGYRQ